MRSMSYSPSAGSRKASYAVSNLSWSEVYPELDILQNDVIQFGNYLQAEFRYPCTAWQNQGPLLLTGSACRTAEGVRQQENLSGTSASHKTAIAAQQHGEIPASQLTPMVS